MGRPLIIIVGGLIVIVGLAQLGAWQRVDLLNNMNVNEYQQTDLRNQALNGLDKGLRKYVQEGTGEDEFSALELNRDNGITVNVTMDGGGEMNLPAGQSRILSVATGYGEQQYEADAIVTTDQVEVPAPDAAIGVYDDGSIVDIRGNVTVSGYDVDEEEDIPGMISRREREEVVDETGNPEIEGEPEDFKQDEDLSEDEFDEIYDEFKDIGDPFDYETNYGTKSNPRVMVLDSDEKFAGGEEPMGGIMVVPEGVNVTFDGKGNFEFYGYILSKGTIDIKGTVNVFGGIMIGGQDSEAEIENEELMGTIKVQHSSSVRDMLENNLFVSDNARIVAISN